MERRSSKYFYKININYEWRRVYMKEGGFRNGLENVTGLCFVRNT